MSDIVSRCPSPFFPGAWPEPSARPPSIPSPTPSLESGLSGKPVHLDRVLDFHQRLSMSLSRSNTETQYLPRRPLLGMENRRFASVDGCQNEQPTSSCLRSYNNLEGPPNAYSKNSALPSEQRDFQRNAPKPENSMAKHQRTTSSPALSPNPNWNHDRRISMPACRNLDQGSETLWYRPANQAFPTYTESRAPSTRMSVPPRTVPLPLATHEMYPSNSLDSGTSSPPSMTPDASSNSMSVDSQAHIPSWSRLGRDRHISHTCENDADTRGSSFRPSFLSPRQANHDGYFRRSPPATPASPDRSMSNTEEQSFSVASLLPSSANDDQQNILADFSLPNNNLTPDVTLEVINSEVGCNTTSTSPYSFSSSDNAPSTLAVAGHRERAHIIRLPEDLSVLSSLAEPSPSNEQVSPSTRFAEEVVTSAWGASPSGSIDGLMSPFSLQAPPSTRAPDSTELPPQDVSPTIHRQTNSVADHIRLTPNRRRNTHDLVPILRLAEMERVPATTTMLGKVRKFGVKVKNIFASKHSKEKRNRRAAHNSIATSRDGTQASSQDSARNHADELEDGNETRQSTASSSNVDHHLLSSPPGLTPKMDQGRQQLRHYSSIPGLGIRSTDNAAQPPTRCANDRAKAGSSSGVLVSSQPLRPSSAATPSSSRFTTPQLPHANSIPSASRIGAQLNSMAADRLDTPRQAHQGMLSPAISTPHLRNPETVAAIRQKNRRFSLSAVINMSPFSLPAANVID